MKKKNYYLILPFMLLFCAFSEKPENLQHNTGKMGNGEKAGVLTMSFQSHAKLAKGTVEQENQLSVLIATDFSGKFTDKDVKKAKWKNITDRFKLSPLTETEDLLPTSADISDLVQKGKPFHIAFKYDTPVQTEEKRYVTWKVRNFKITSGTDTVSLVQQGVPLTLYTKGEKEPGRTVSFKSQVIFRGNLKKAGLAYPTEDWAISAAITAP